MMQQKTRMHPGVALNAALELMAMLGDVVGRIEIGGSLRRCAETVGDIELVMMPRFMQQQGLFGAQGKPINLLDQRFHEMFVMGIVKKRYKDNGSLISWPDSDARYRAMVYRGIPVDAFIVLPDRDWGPTMLIRTGPGAANGVLVTREGVTNREGNVGILPHHLTMNEGSLWDGATRLHTPEERDVFHALEMCYIEPHLRSVEAYQRAAARRAVYRSMGGARGSVVSTMSELHWRVRPAWESMRSAA